MNALRLFILCSVLVVSFAEDEMEKMVKFYDCIACGEDKEEARAEYVKCKELKPELGKELTESCKKELIPKENLESWTYICHNSEILLKVFGCIVKQAGKFTDEDLTNLNKYQDCVNKVEEKYCASAEKKST